MITTLFRDTNAELFQYLTSKDTPVIINEIFGNVKRIYVGCNVNEVFNKNSNKIDIVIMLYDNYDQYVSGDFVDFSKLRSKSISQSSYWFDGPGGVERIISAIKNLSQNLNVLICYAGSANPFDSTRPNIINLNDIISKVIINISNLDCEDVNELLYKSARISFKLKGL